MADEIENVDGVDAAETTETRSPEALAYIEQRTREIEAALKGETTTSVPNNEDLMGLEKVGEAEFDKGLLFRLNNLGINPEEVSAELKEYEGKILDSNELNKVSRKIAASYELKSNPIAAAALTGDTTAYLEEYQQINQGIGEMQQWLDMKENFLVNYHASTLFEDFIQKTEGERRAPSKEELEFYGKMAYDTIGKLPQERQAKLEQTYRAQIETQINASKEALKNIAPSISAKAQERATAEQQKLLAEWEKFVEDKKTNAALVLAEVAPTEFINDIDVADFQKYLANQLKVENGRLAFETNFEQRIVKLATLEYLDSKGLLKGLPAKVANQVQNRYLHGRNGKK